MESDTLADELARLDKKYKRGIFTPREYESQRQNLIHYYTCPNNHLPTLDELGIHDDRFEVHRKPLNTCPDCKASIFRISCFTWPTEEEERNPDIVICSSSTCCCPRCGGKIMSYEVMEYEPRCSICGRVVGTGKHRRMVIYGESPRKWECEECFESPNKNDTNPIETVKPNASNWVRCPGCGKHFALYNKQSWDGEQRVSCRQRLIIGKPA
jgi:hypothetical protein